MRIRTQSILLTALFGIALVVISVSALTTSWQLERTDRQETLAASVAQGASELSYLSNDYVIYQEMQQLSRWQSRYTAFSAEVASLDVERPEHQALVRNIKANEQRLKEVFESIVATVGSTPQGANDLALVQVSWSRMAVQSQGLVSDATRLSQLLRDEADRLRQTNLLVILAALGLFGAYYVVNFLMVQRRILKSLATLQRGTAVVGAGDLGYRLEAKARDEIGDLSRAFNRMTSDLGKVTASKNDLEREIAERQKAEAALKRSEQRFRLIFENIQESFVIQEVITDGGGKVVDLRFVEVNPVAEKALEKSRAELVGRKRSEALGPMLPQTLEFVNRVYLTGKPEHTENYIPSVDRWFEVFVYAPQPGLIATLNLDITERRKAEQQAARRKLIQEGINRILDAYLKCATQEEMSLHCLNVASELTQSKIGFIGEIGPDGLLHDTAMSEMGWESCAMQDKTGHRRPAGSFKLHGLYGWVVNEGKGLLTNDPSAHLASIGTPAGHPGLKAFLGVPLIHGGNTFGLLALGNREGGYRAEDLETLEALAPAIVETTMRKRTDQKVAEQAAMLASVHDAVIGHDMGLHVTYWNEGAERLYGYAAGEITGHVMAEVLKPVYAGASREELLARLYREGHVEMESVRTTKEGRQAHVETHTFMLLDDKGAPTGSVSIDRDITERKRAEERLAYLASFPELNPLFVTEIDREGNVTYANPTTRNAFPGVETAGDEHPYHAGLSQNLLAENATLTRELKIGERYYEQTVTAVPRSQNSRTYGRDITDRKKAEEALRRYASELEAVNKELEAFSYSVSHDLRAPLRSMEGFSSALLEDYEAKLDAQGKQYLKAIQDSSELMGRLIDDLLKLSRITRSEMSLEKVNLSDLAKNVVAELQNAEPRRKVKVAIAPDLAARGDRNLVRLALQNLVGNAWKFTGKVGSARIEVGVTERDGKRAFFVRDNGAGFDMAYADKLFKPFQRLHGSREFSGTGIGLATVYRIVRRHGGEIWAESAVGEGATFYFTLG